MTNVLFFMCCYQLPFVDSIGFYGHRLVDLHYLQDSDTLKCIIWNQNMGKINVKKVLPQLDNDLRITMVIIGSFATFILLYISLVEMGGPAGSAIAAFLKGLLGRIAFVVPFLFLLLGAVLVRIQQNPESEFRNQILNGRNVWGFTLLVVASCSLINVFSGVENTLNIDMYGGYVGYIFYPLILDVFSPIGAFVIMFSVGFYGFFLLTQMKFTNFLDTCKAAAKNPRKIWDLVPDVYELWQDTAPQLAQDKAPDKSSKTDDEMEEMISSVIYDGSFSKGLNVKKKSTTSDNADEEASKIKEFIDVVISKPTKKQSEDKPVFSASSGSSDSDMVELTPKKKTNDGTWSSPPTNLLKISKVKNKQNTTEAERTIKKNQDIIKNTLEHFGIKVQMGDTYIGPTVTQYTLKPANGVRLYTIEDRKSVV